MLWENETADPDPEMRDRNTNRDFLFLILLGAWVALLGIVLVAALI